MGFTFLSTMFHIVHMAPYCFQWLSAPLSQCERSESSISRALQCSSRCKNTMLQLKNVSCMVQSRVPQSLMETARTFSLSDPPLIERRRRSQTTVTAALEYTLFIELTEIALIVVFP